MTAPTYSDTGVAALDQEPKPPLLEETVCRHLHAVEWSAPEPRTSPCLPCSILALVIRRNHGGRP